jgi:hypothetical protein
MPILVIIIFLFSTTACSIPNNATSETSSTTEDKIFSTQNIASAEVTECSNDCLDGMEDMDLVAPRFYTYEDYGTFMRTQSTDLSLYSKETPPYAIDALKSLYSYFHHYFSHAPFLDIAKVLGLDDECLQHLEYLQITTGIVTLAFDSGVTIMYSYNPKLYSAAADVTNSATKDFAPKRYSLNQIVGEGVLQSGEMILQNVDDCVIAYYAKDGWPSGETLGLMMQFGYYEITIIISAINYNHGGQDGVRLYDSIETLLQDPSNKCIARFFSESSDRSEAVNQIKHTIASKEAFY